MTEVRCGRCGGPLAGLNVWHGNHRHLTDCIEFLKKVIGELEPRAAFGDQCYQDRCENAYVEQSVVKRLEDIIEEVINDVPDCGPKSKYKLFKAIQISKASR